MKVEEFFVRFRIKKSSKKEKKVEKRKAESDVRQICSVNRHSQFNKRDVNTSACIFNEWLDVT